MVEGTLIQRRSASPSTRDDSPDTHILLAIEPPGHLSTRRSRVRGIGAWSFRFVIVIVRTVRRIPEEGTLS